MSAHDAIRPTLENAYDEDWDGAKQDIAMQIWQRYMNTPEMAIGENAQLREQFAAQRKEVRDIARQQALEARAKAQIAAAQQDRKAQDDLLEPYRRAAAKANYRKEVAEQFAKKQKASVEARVQLEKDKRLKLSLTGWQTKPPRTAQSPARKQSPGAAQPPLPPVEVVDGDRERLPE